MLTYFHEYFATISNKSYYLSYFSMSFNFSFWYLSTLFALQYLILSCIFRTSSYISFSRSRASYPNLLFSIGSFNDDTWSTRLLNFLFLRLVRCNMGSNDKGYMLYFSKLLLSVLTIDFCTPSSLYFLFYLGSFLISS